MHPTRHDQPRSTSLFPLSTLITAVAAALALVAGCGGGSPDSSPVAAGAATATAYTEGTLNGFGSIIVNGVRFDETSASVTDDGGVQRTASSLKLGMSVEVDSGAVADGAARAHAVRFGSRVLGPVSALNLAAGTATVLGQVVDVTTATVFDTTLAAGLSALSVGAVVEVHGLPDAATGHVLATRVDSVASATAYKLRGVVSALNSTAKTFSMGAAQVSYAGVASVPAALANGQTIRVTLATTPVAGVWMAQNLGAARHQPADTMAVQLRGSITAFSSASSFHVNGLAVDASAATFPDGSTGLALGVQVEVKGTVRNGVLVASQVGVEAKHQQERDRHFELHGAITAVDSVARSFVVRGVTVSYAGSVAYTGGTVADLIVGAKVAVRGGVGSTRSQVLATEISFGS